MVFYDVLLTPAAMLRRPHGQSSRPFKPGRHPRPRWKHLVAPLADRLVLRIVVMGAAVLVYVQGRGWLAGDHLVRIFRKVSCPQRPAKLVRYQTGIWGGLCTGRLDQHECTAISVR